jgi:hypothetical protein
MATTLSAVEAGEIFPSDLRPAEAHVVQFYTDDSVLLDGLGASLGNALIAGESVVAVVTKAHDKGLRRQLLARNIDVEKASKDGRLSVMDTVEALKLFMTPSGPDRQIPSSVWKYNSHGTSGCRREKQACGCLWRDGRSALEAEKI